MTKVMVGLQDPIANVGLSVVIDGCADLECVGALTRGDDVRATVSDRAPDVLVLDVRHRRSDPSLVPDLVAATPGLFILIAVDHSPEECALRHLLALGSRAGLSAEALGRLDDCCLTSLRQQATGCVDAEASPHVMLEAIRAVSAGKLAAAPWLEAVAETVHSLSPAKTDPNSRPITERELEVIALLAEGLTNRAIAARLGIKEQTVKNHVTRAVTKLGAHTRLEVGLMASRHHLRLSPD